MDIDKIKEQVKLKIAYTNFLEENKKSTNRTRVIIIGSVILFSFLWHILSMRKNVL